MESDRLRTARMSAQAILSLWDEFENTVRRERRPNGILYHGDVDGVIGAASVALRLKEHVDIDSFWIPTEDYDFVSATNWVIQTAPHALSVIDLGLENNPRALGAIAAVPSSVFLYDHHVVTSSEVYPKNVLLANPTPFGHSTTCAPVPSFLFADELLRRKGLELPRWLLLVAFFSEGVDQFFPGDVGRLLEECCGISGRPTPREAFQRTPLAKLSVLIRAAFATISNQDQRVLTAVSKAILLSPPSASEFVEKLQGEFGEAADGIASAIREEVDVWMERLRGADPRSLAVVRVDSLFAIVGPVASILRGRLNATILGVQERAGRVTIELRAPNESNVNFPSLLASVAAQVPTLHHGGHRTAAGAAVRPEDKDAFIESFVEIFDGAT